MWGDSQVSVRARSSEKMLGKWNVRHDRPRVPCAEVGYGEFCLVLGWLGEVEVLVSGQRGI